MVTFSDTSQRVLFYVYVLSNDFKACTPESHCKTGKYKFKMGTILGLSYRKPEYYGSVEL